MEWLPELSRVFAFSRRHATLIQYGSNFLRSRLLNWGSQSDAYMHFGLVRLHSGSIGEKLKCDFDVQD